MIHIRLWVTVRHTWKTDWDKWCNYLENKRRQLMYDLHGRQRESKIKVASVSGRRASPRDWSVPSRSCSARLRRAPISWEPSGIFFNSCNNSVSWYASFTWTDKINTMMFGNKPNMHILFFFVAEIVTPQHLRVYYHVNKFSLTWMWITRIKFLWGMNIVNDWKYVQMMNES